jgi:hypothetical protein
MASCLVVFCATPGTASISIAAYPLRAPREARCDGCVVGAAATQVHKQGLFSHCSLHTPHIRVSLSLSSQQAVAFSPQQDTQIHTLHSGTCWAMYAHILWAGMLEGRVGTWVAPHRAMSPPSRFDTPCRSPNTWLGAAISSLLCVYLGVLMLCTPSLSACTFVSLLKQSGRGRRDPPHSPLVLRRVGRRFVPCVARFRTALCAMSQCVTGRGVCIRGYAHAGRTGAWACGCAPRHSALPLLHPVSVPRAPTDSH